MLFGSTTVPRTWDSTKQLLEQKLVLGLLGVAAARAFFQSEYNGPTIGTSFGQ